MTANFAIRIADDVREALDNGRPVVALESTILTHGLPRPRNVEVARQAIEVAEANGALAATIGVFHGVPTVGLSDDEIVELSHDDGAAKASLRDLCAAAVSGVNAGTTISATAFLAHHAGITVFSTGGLGGVHHGASQTFDESADMTTLSQIPIVLISAGAKAILDIQATLERFETLSVPVVGYGTMRYPGFYVRDSGFDLTHRVDTPEQVADLYRAQSQYGITSAILIANPIDEDKQLDPAELDRVLREAWAAAEEQHIHGQESTPFLLDYIQIHTQGRSLDANVALYLGNVELGSKVAAELTAAG